jgi:hypothetical protein
MPYSKLLWLTETGVNNYSFDVGRKNLPLSPSLSRRGW